MCINAHYCLLDVSIACVAMDQSTDCDQLRKVSVLALNCLQRIKMGISKTHESLLCNSNDLEFNLKIESDWLIISVLKSCRNQLGFLHS